MISRMTSASLYHLTRSLDAYQEQTIAYGAAIPIQITISLTTGTSSAANNVLTSSSTHVGVSDYKLVSKGDKVVVGSDTYIVDYPVLDGKLAMLYLKKES